MNTRLIYLERDGKYLMLHRIKKKNDINKDKWIGVGGKFLPGESPDECARREALEETGLTLGKLEYRAVVTFLLNENEAEYMHLFTCREFWGDLCECDEGTLEWVDKKEVEALPLWAGDKIFFRLLEEGYPFFSLKLTYRGEELLSAVLDGEELIVDQRHRF